MNTMNPTVKRFLFFCNIFISSNKTSKEKNYITKSIKIFPMNISGPWKSTALRNMKTNVSSLSMYLFVFASLLVSFVLK